jgi:HPt (histidine-containing phosphotransfer) domain-containing protein
MTFGEENLAREVLRRFGRQADTLLAHIKRARPNSATRLAHTLKGSARGIGAWKATATAEEFELAAQESDSKSWLAILSSLAAPSWKRAPPSGYCWLHQDNWDLLE